MHIGVLKLYSERLDFCDVLRENDVEVQCPIPPGDYDVSHTVLVPARLPPGTYAPLSLTRSQVLDSCHRRYTGQSAAAMRQHWRERIALRLPNGLLSPCRATMAGCQVAPPFVSK